MVIETETATMTVTTVASAIGTIVVLETAMTGASETGMTTATSWVK
jgi:hypothetical protein